MPSGTVVIATVSIIPVCFSVVRKSPSITLFSAVGTV